MASSGLLVQSTLQATGALRMEEGQVTHPPRVGEPGVGCAGQVEGCRDQHALPLSRAALFSRSPGS